LQLKNKEMNNYLNSLFSLEGKVVLLTVTFPPS